MSSRGRRQAGVDRESEYRRARDHRDSYRPAAQGDHEYAESELSYISAFEDLNLNSTRNAQYPTVTASSSRSQNNTRNAQYPTATASPSGSQNPLARPYHGLSPHAELGPMQGNVQSTEPQLELGIDAHNSLGLVADHINPSPAGAPRISPYSPSRSLRQNVENPYYASSYYSRQEGHASPSWWRSPSEFGRPPERGFQGYRPYPEEDRFIGSRRTEMTLECQCRTCVEHRHAIRNWAISRYDNRGISLGSNHHPYTYSGQPPRRRHPTEADPWYRNEDYYYGSPDNDSDYSSYRSGSSISDGYRNYAVHNPRQLHRRTTDPRNVYYESDHEDSDGASYTGYEHYDEYGGEYGEYDGGDYSD